MPKLSETFPKLLRRLMETGNFSKAEFAKKTGISRMQLDRYLSGETSPTLETVQVLAGRLRVEPINLLLQPGMQAEHPIEECHRRIGELVSRHAAGDRWWERLQAGTLSEKDVAEMEAALKKLSALPKKTGG